MSIIGVAIIGGAGIAASIYGANQQSKATANAASLIQQGQQQAIGTEQRYLGPYANFGQSLQPTLSSLLTPGPSQTETLSKLPGFQFARDMTGYGIAAGAGRTGISGTTAVAGGNLESALASSNLTNFVNPLLDLYRQGQGAASSLAGGISGVQTGGAQNLAQLAVGQGNIQAGLAGNIGSSLTNALLLSKLTGGGLNTGLHMDSGGFYFGQ